MKELKVVERIAKRNADNFEILSQVRTKDILAIAKAFRALEQRAEAAEAKLVSVTESRDQWKANAHEFSRCADRLEAKLAELEKQEPVAYTDEEELKVMRQGTYADMFTPHDSYKSDPQWIPLFTRPAPAVSLAELVPDAIDGSSLSLGLERLPRRHPAQH